MKEGVRKGIIILAIIGSIWSMWRYGEEVRGRKEKEEAAAEVLEEEVLEEEEKKGANKKEEEE